jgi:hypothetical protein
MDDYTSNVLNDSKNEWSILLMNYVCPHIIDGFKAIFNESIKLCEANDEIEKYLMTFQNLLSRIPKWNQTIILAEKDRIVKLCNCSYLEDLITCVHIIQLKILSCVRVGNETKKISIDIPDMTSFIHQIYINIARKLYSNIYLFEIDVPPLEQQRRNREFELLVQTCIMNTIRDKIPVETLLRQFIDETQEIEVVREETVLNTAKPLEEIPIQTKPFENQITQNVNQTMNQNSVKLEPSVSSFRPLPKFDPEPVEPEPDFENENDNENENVFEPSPSPVSNFMSDTSRKSSISFNPTDSILEIDNIESLEPVQFETLDTPVNLDFEEL